MAENHLETDSKTKPTENIENEDLHSLVLEMSQRLDEFSKLGVTIHSISDDMKAMTQGVSVMYDNIEELKTNLKSARNDMYQMRSDIRALQADNWALRSDQNINAYVSGTNQPSSTFTQREGGTGASFYESVRSKRQFPANHHE